MDKNCEKVKSKSILNLKIFVYNLFFAPAIRSGGIQALRNPVSGQVFDNSPIRGALEPVMPLHRRIS